MSDEPRELIPLPCVQCGRPGVARVGIEGGHYVQVCLDHLHQHEALRIRKIEMYRQMAEDAEDAMDDIVGLPRKIRPHRIPTPRLDLKQINVQGDNLGIINTGVAGSITNDLSVIHTQDAALAAQLRELTEAILTSTILDDAGKREATDLLNEVIVNAAKPQTERRSLAVMSAIVSGLERVLANAANLATLWTAIASHLSA